MQEITFYRQRRHDGGTRSGLEGPDGTNLLECFEAGPIESREDPLGSALLWYIDLRRGGVAVAPDAEEARSWFLDHSVPIRQGLNRLADLLRAGIDDSFPLRWSEFPGLPPSDRLIAVCSTSRGMLDDEFSKILREHADNLDQHLRDLKPPRLVPEPSMP